MSTCQHAQLLTIMQLTMYNVLYSVLYVPHYWLKHFNLEKASNSLIDKTLISTHLSVLPNGFFVKCYVTTVVSNIHCTIQ